MKQLLQETIELISTSVNPKYTFAQISNVLQRLSQEIKKMDLKEKAVPTEADIEKGVKSEKPESLSEESAK